MFVAWCVMLGAHGLRRIRRGAPQLRAIAATAVVLLLLAPQIPVGRRQLELMSWSREMPVDHAGLRDTIRMLPADARIAAFHAPRCT